MSQTIVLCADDYAFTAPVSRAILTLAKNKRISAISCMTASPHWPEHGPWLKAVQDDVDVGLHITLVDEAPLTKMPKTAPGGRLPSIGALILKSYLGLLDLKEIRAEIEAQKQAFENVMGFPPRHLDGHLHTHVLPDIRDIVIAMAQDMTPRPWLRSTADSAGAIIARGIAVPKALFLSALGGGFAKTAGPQKNDSFSGVYAFSARSAYGALFERFVHSIAERHLILCHPGEAADTADHAALRAAEYAFLNSVAFQDSLARHGLRIGRFAEAGS